MVGHSPLSIRPLNVPTLEGDAALVLAQVISVFTTAEAGGVRSFEIVSPQTASDPFSSPRPNVDFIMSCSP